LTKIAIKLIVILIITSSCSSKFSIQKRKYNNGIYFAHSKNSSNKCNSTKTISKKLNTEETYVTPNVLHNNENIAIKNEISNDANFENKSALIVNKNFKSEEKSQKHSVAPVVVNVKNNLPLINYNFKAISQKKLIGKKNDFLNFLGNLYLGYLIICLVIAAAFLVYILFQVYPLIQVLAILAVCILIIIALAGLGSLVRRGR
jgi:hypothetical protein